MRQEPRWRRGRGQLPTCVQKAKAIVKSLTWRLSLMAAFAMWMAFGTTLARAAEEPGGATADQPGRKGPGPGGGFERGGLGAGAADRLARLEERINELAQRQEQLMRRLGVEPRQPQPLLRQAPGQPALPEPVAQPGPGQLRQLLPLRGALIQAATETFQHLSGLLKLCVLVGIIFNILLAVWIYTDIRKRGEGSGIFIALALLAGIPAAIIYTLVRIGDKKT